MNSSLAPIVLFVYNRPWHTRQTLEAIKRNEWAQDSILYIFSDGPKENATREDITKIEEVRSLIREEKWCGKVRIVEKARNFGLAQSVINGVGEVIQLYSKVIVLEDDIVPGKYFLQYMNNGLNIFQEDKNVFGISGFKYPSSSEVKLSTYFLPIMSSWSYATWLDRWNKITFKEVDLLKKIERKNLQDKMNFGNYPFYEMLQDQVNQKIDSWAIRFYTSMFLEKGLFLFPNQPLVTNIGFDNSGIHCGESPFFEVPNKSDEEINITLQDAALNKEIVDLFRRSFVMGFNKKRKTKKRSFFKRKFIKYCKSAIRKVKRAAESSNLELSEDYIQKENWISDLKIQNGRIWSELLKGRALRTIHEAEFKVFSQWGDDGIVQYIIQRLAIKNEVFIEFGVEDYQEANTRFLLINNNWSGLVLDGSEINISKIKKNEIYWKHDLIAKSAFITAENVNQLIEEEGIKGPIGLLHIDIDGNDYWIWKAIEVVDPSIVIIEYNSLFGSEKAITIPYNKDFDRTSAFYNNLYFGASLLSLCDLGEEKGYSFIGCNSAGNNAFFIKKEFNTQFPVLTAAEGYVSSKFRESRNKKGQLSHIRGRDRLNSLKALPVYNTRKNKIEYL